MFKFAAVFAGSYIWHALGVTIGYHRLLAHRSFSCSKPVEYFWTVPAYLAFEGAPIWWATIHRAHHRHVETPLDPHSPKNGLARAWWGWVFDGHYPQHINPEVQAKDLIKDPIYSFLEQDGEWWKSHSLAATINILFRLAILIRFGWIPATASMLAGLAVMQVPVMLNVFCHMSKLGYRNFKTPDDSVNIWWVALLAMGEGWHNNHHAMPGSAQSGIKASEWDVSWMVIQAMEKMGLVSKVNRPSAAELAEVTAVPQIQTAAERDELLSVSEAAKYLGVAKQTLAVWRSSKRYNLPFLKVGRFVRYKRVDLDRWLATRRLVAPLGLRGKPA